MSFTIPVQRVIGATEALRRRGMDPAEVLDRAAIAPELVRRRRARVTAEQLETVLATLWSATGDELLGLGRAPVPPGSFRLLMYGMQSAPDLGAQLERFHRLQSSTPGYPELVVESDPTTGLTSVGFDIDYVSRPVEVIVDTLLVLTHGCLSWSVDARLELAEVHVPYGPAADLADHERLFGAPVRYGARRPAFQFDTALLASPTVRGDDEVEEFLRHAPVQMLARRVYRSTLADRVRLLVATRLPAGEPATVEDVASELAMSPQTLRRRLHADGTSASAIRDDVRRDLAVAALVAGDSVDSVSRRLGFAEASTFSRAFRRWTGSAPGAYRQTRAVRSPS